MSLLLSMVRAFPSRFLMKRKLKDLYALTARAFGGETPDLRNLSWDACLRHYAVFTRTEVEKARAAGADLSLLSARLRENAAALGRQLRAQLRIRTPGDARDGLSLLYSAIKIDLQTSGNGDVSVPRCFFSAYYTPEVCRLVSALDEGLAEGFTGGGRLQFSQRITEGKECCRGVLLMREVET